MKADAFPPTSDHLSSWLSKREISRSALCVGVVTKNAVDAAIEVAYETRRPIMLIASRNQLDHSIFEPGYVGWSTETFAAYMAHCAPDRLVPLCRDHGGPWQHLSEVQATLDEDLALSSALVSLKADIDAGFDVLHIDTSVDLSGEVPPNLAIERLIKIYKEIVAYMREVNTTVEFEIGFEGQQAGLQDPKEFETSLAFIMKEFERLNLPKPGYVVVQTGTKVSETENIGVITEPRKREEVRENLHTLVGVCNKYGAGLKAHNCDYLPPESWQMLSALQIGGANVAPEYGVAETYAFLDILTTENWRSVRERFLQIAYDSGKWRKWMSSPTVADDYKRAVIAGHYVFTTPEVVALRRLVGQRLFGGIDALDNYLKRAVKGVILQHLNWYNQF